MQTLVFGYGLEFRAYVLGFISVDHLPPVTVPRKLPTRVPSRIHTYKGAYNKGSHQVCQLRVYPDKLGA